MSTENTTISISNTDYSIQPGLTSGEKLYQLVECSADDHTIILDVPNELDIPIQSEDFLIITGNESFVLHSGCLQLPENPPLRNTISFTLNGEQYCGDDGFRYAKTSTAQLADKIADGSSHIFVIDIKGQVDIVLPNNKSIIIGSQWNILSFPGEAPTGEPCQPVETYTIKVNGKEHHVEAPSMLANEIIALSGQQDPTKHELNQILLDGDSISLEKNDKVHFTDPGIECFITIPLDMTEGFDARKQFSLPPDDIQFLESLGLNWEAVIEKNIRRVIIHDFPIPEGYNVNKVMVNVRIEARYPDVQIDMAYFYPEIHRHDRKTIKAISMDDFDQKRWQRWSRHRTPSNPWRPGIDNLSTHMSAVKQWLLQELNK